MRTSSNCLTAVRKSLTTENKHFWNSVPEIIFYVNWRSYRRPLLKKKLKKKLKTGPTTAGGGRACARGLAAVECGLERRPVPARAPARPPQSWGPFFF